MKLVSRWTCCAVAVAAFLAVSTSSPCARAQASADQQAAASQDTAKIAQEVAKQISGLSNYGVFDWITFRVDNGTVVLMGYASRPSLKSSAERVAKKVKGVNAVDNQIKVLPLSRMDDRVRIGVYDRIYRQPNLRIYNANQGGFFQATGPIAQSQVRMGQRAVDFPPVGFNAIHIIVDNGNVTLFGQVNSEADKNIAGIQANSTPGTFKVTNNLTVAPESAKHSKKKK
jgi:osmotically-inducible protein OsmY